jgi:hypothetical protein
VFLRLLSFFCALLVAGATAGSAQTPQPFPKPPQTTTPTKPPAPTVPAPAASSPNAKDVPNEAMLGAPIYPSAQFITSYEAGRGQRFYLFGVSASYLEMVTFYRAALKQKGSELFESPPTHQFDIGRFREETMAFPPSVTIKDYTWGGSAGYPNPHRGKPPERFPTVIQIVAAPPGTPPGE